MSSEPAGKDDETPVKGLHKGGSTKQPKSGSPEQHTPSCKMGGRRDGGHSGRKPVPCWTEVAAAEEEILTVRAIPGEGPTGGRLSFQRGTHDVIYGNYNNDINSCSAINRRQRSPSPGVAPVSYSG